MAKSPAFNLSAASTSIERWQISVSCPFSPSMTFVNRTTYRAIEEATYAHVQDEIHCEEHGNIRVRGMAYPVTTYRGRG